MIKQETFSILKHIAAFYDQFVVDQGKLDMWYEVLKGYSYEKVQKNLVVFVENSSIPPKISDLVQKSAYSKTIPNPEETKKFITARVKPASEEVIQRELAKMRAILGIVRGQD